MDSWATYKPTMQAWVNLIRASHQEHYYCGQPGMGPDNGDAAHESAHGRQHHLLGQHVQQHYNKGVGGNVTQVNNAAKGVPLIMTEWGFCGSVSPAMHRQPGRGTKYHRHLRNAHVELASKAWAEAGPAGARRIAGFRICSRQQNWESADRPDEWRFRQGLDVHEEGSELGQLTTLVFGTSARLSPSARVEPL